MEYYCAGTTLAWRSLLFPEYIFFSVIVVLLRGQRDQKICYNPASALSSPFFATM
jgi:hypothetical protein